MKKKMKKIGLFLLIFNYNPTSEVFNQSITYNTTIYYIIYNYVSPDTNDQC